LVGALISGGVISLTDFHVYLTRILHARRLKLLERFLSSQIISDKALHIYYSVRLAHDRGEGCVSASQLYEMYLNMSDNSFLRRAFLHLAIEQAVRESDIPVLLHLLSGKTDEHLRKIPSSCFMGACRVLIKSSEHDQCRQLLRRYLAFSPPHRRFYFLEPARALFGPNDDDMHDLTRPRAWRTILSEFSQSYDAVDEDDRRTFDTLVLQKLDQIPGGTQDCMDIRFDAHAKSRLWHYIAEAIEAGRALSFVRLGDGEAYAYPPPGIPAVPAERFVDDKFVLEQHWWGTTLMPERRAEIGDQVREAVAQATILGIPSVYRVIRDLGKADRRFGSSRSERGLSTVLHALGTDIPIGDQIFTEERSNHILFDRKSLEDLARRAHRLVIVGCWSPDKLALSTYVETNYVLISPHMKVNDVAGHDNASTPVYLAYSEIGRSIEALSGPGVLVLVSAGIIGKIFAERARRSGAVALDIGSVADYLAGHKTRSIADLV
jgi:hypothetical protein